MMSTFQRDLPALNALNIDTGLTAQLSVAALRSQTKGGEEGLCQTQHQIKTQELKLLLSSPSPVFSLVAIATFKAGTSDLVLSVLLDPHHV